MFALLWVLLPALLSAAPDVPLVTVRAASLSALVWLTLALSVLAATLLLAGWGMTRRLLLVSLTGLCAFWCAIPVLLLESEAQRFVTVIASHNLALCWMQVAVAGTALTLIRAGHLFSALYRSQRQRETVLALVHDQLDEGIALFDRRLRPLWANDAARGYFYQADKLQPEVQRLVEKAAASRRVTSQSMSVTELMRVNVQAIPYGDGVVSVVASPVQNDSATFYERFIRRTVHDMRNPLAAIIAHASNLQSTPDSDRTAFRSTAETIEHEAQRLTRLVDSMLFDARLSYVPLALEVLDLRDVIEDVFLQHDERAFREEKLLELDMPSEAAPLEADRDLLVRAISNLVDNSLKYSRPDAMVRLTLETLDDRYLVQVSDTGDGIPPEYLPDRIFEALVRARPREGGGGSGLGLSIVKKIVEMHGGSIRADSVLGQGTTMTMQLPKPRA
jgi:signal transduction histidine kinase